MFYTTSIRINIVFHIVWLTTLSEETMVVVLTSDHALRHKVKTLLSVAN